LQLPNTVACIATLKLVTIFFETS